MGDIKGVQVYGYNRSEKDCRIFSAMHLLESSCELAVLKPSVAFGCANAEPTQHAWLGPLESGLRCDRHAESRLGTKPHFFGSK